MQVEASEPSVFSKAMSRFGGLFGRTAPPGPKVHLTAATQRTVALMDTGLAHDEHANLVRFQMENEEKAAEMRHKKILEMDATVGACIPWPTPLKTESKDHW